MARPVYEQRGLAAFAWFTRFIRDSIRCLSEAHRHGDLCVGYSCLPWGPRGQKSIFAFGPEYNHQVLSDLATFRVTNLTVGGPHGSALRRIRHGLIGMNGSEHQQQRQIVSPWFVKKAVDGYRDATVRLTEQHLATWRVGQKLDIWQEMRRLTLRTASHVLFGRETPEQAEALGRMIHELFERNFSPWSLLFPFNWPGTPFRGLLRHAEQIERALRETIARRRGSPTEQPDVFDRLIQAHDAGQMSDAALVGQATVLFAASYETQASSLTWALFLLSQHPCAMQNLWDELGTLNGEPPSVEQLDALPLLDAVLKESLRLLPTVPYIIRAVTGPAELNGVPLQAEDRVLLSQYITHRLPEIYANPARFDPLRWFTLKPSPYEYFPFGGGSRVCIGRVMSLMTLRISLAMIVQRWRLAMVPGARIDRTVRVALAPKHGLPMIAHPLGGPFESAPVRGNIHEMVDLTGPHAAAKRIVVTS